MARHIDLTNKFDTEKPSITIGEHTFVINDEKTNILIMNQIMCDESLDEFKKMDKMIETLLGKKQAKELENMKLSFSAFQTVTFALMAAINDEEIEVMEKRFQNKQL